MLDASNFEIYFTKKSKIKLFKNIFLLSLVFVFYYIFRGQKDSVQFSEFSHYVSRIIYAKLSSPFTHESLTIVMKLLHHFFVPFHLSIFDLFCLCSRLREREKERLNRLKSELVVVHCLLFTNKNPRKIPKNRENIENYNRKK